MSLRQDNIRRRSFSYRFKHWFFSNHRKEVETITGVIGELLLTIAFFGSIFILPHFFH